MPARKKTKPDDDQVQAVPAKAPDMALLAQDPDKLAHGAWAAHSTGVRVKVVPPGPDYFEYVRAAGMPYRMAAQETGKVPKDVADRVRAEATARFLLKDWNITEGGKPVTCNVANAERYFKDPRYFWFRDFTNDAAFNEDVFRAQVEGDDAGN